MSTKPIRSALISVFYKDNLENLVRYLNSHGVKLYSTGGTQSFIEELGIPVEAVEDVTSYPSIFGGRVKTLHPKVFGGILHRREHEQDQEEVVTHDIPPIDMVVVDLYPFEETVASGASHDEIIEKIDIGGISLIRAAAKNFKDVLIVSSRNQYDKTLQLLEENQCQTSIDDRKQFAREAFDISSHYDSAIFNFFDDDHLSGFKQSFGSKKELRYGENPHQQAAFFGPIGDMLEQLHGKELSYNNLVDIDAAINLIEEFPNETAFAILKHTNACGVAIAETVKDAYLKALQADNISAFGGILVTNQKFNAEAAEEVDKLFFEVLIAPQFDEAALDILKSKKNRILLQQKAPLYGKVQFKSLLNGVIQQDRDLKTEGANEFQTITDKKPTTEEMAALAFAAKVAKHTKSNTIVLAKDGQLFASGVGQTSRVDALKQAIAKAKNFGFNLSESVMASDAFFPFPDCVEIANAEGIKAVIQPGGSVKDQASIDFCNEHEMAMVFTGIRHFKH